MSEEVVQWLTEIRALREELAQCKDERDAAYKSAAHWRELYAKEAQQRRVEARLAQENIVQLEAELRQLKNTDALLPTDRDGAHRLAAIESEVAALDTVQQLQQKLAEVLQSRDRAIASLRKEQEHHQRTRSDLTAALGDTVDELHRVKSAKNYEE
ncbi:hypothetical protein IQ249_17795 [Lusitaniella coriacea LEGE 07157]|uniref:Uncharacterized protein n=1 Tax=Lusitaniella coriacea LEGE 07157 TaxID=945747 RepID=A0A8J7J530_9CYAN|nr:hypothetical protein [Lusitaniella coriacea]MBE9117754.1 hypothetical protein [Lusitaniella coriacea LEGE 07157]